MKKSSKAIIIVVCAFTIPNLTSCGFSKNGNSDTVPALVTASNIERKLSTVSKGNIEKVFSVNGKIVPLIERDLSFKGAGGYLTKLNIKAGSTVKKGTVIAELDSKDLRYQTQQEEIKVQLAEIDYDEAVKSKSNAFDIKKAKLNLEAENLNLDKLRGDLSNTVLTADMSGVITSIGNLKLYEKVEPYEVIGTIADPSSYQVECNEPNEKLTAGTQVKINYYDSSQGGQNTSDGEVISNVKNGDSRLIMFKFTNQPQGVRLGNEVSVRYVEAKASDVLILPVEAVKTGAGDHPYVRIFKNGDVVEKYIDTGIDDGKNIEVKNGLSVGDKVVTD